MCDCDTCCTACGHEPGCSIHEPAPAPAAVDPTPGSFLAWLLEPTGDAA